MALHIVILAGGAGKRMFSERPKVLHQLGGVSMLQRVVGTARQLKPDQIHVIYGHQGEQLKNALPDASVNWVLQEQQLGTGHAVLQALAYIPKHAQVLILSGDVPLIQAKTLHNLLSHPHALALLVARLPNPQGLGRIVRDSNQSIIAIVEEKDANPAEKKIQEIYSGVCALPATHLHQWLPNIRNCNAQKEHYLTDIIAMAVADFCPIEALHTDNIYEIKGVNTKLQLEQLERFWQQQQAEKFLSEGVAIADSQSFYLRGELTCGRDVSIDINCIFIGKVIVGDGCIIGPNCVLANSTIGNGSAVKANSVVEDSLIGADCSIGPFARLRTGTVLAEKCRIGNFVETKAVQLGCNTKASHLSYLGDATIGANVNIGAGTITCNYDGINKNKTTIADNAFIGSGTQLIAPISIGDGATIGAGSTLRKDAPAHQLTLSISQEKTISSWKRPAKNTTRDSV